MPLTAQFSYGADVVNVVVDDGYAVVPTLPIGVVSVRLRGDGPNGVIATANEIVLPVVRGFEDGGTPSVPPDPDLYNMLLLRVEEARDAAVGAVSTAKDAANAARKSAETAQEARQGAQAAQQAIEDLEVSSKTLEPGSEATVTKTVSPEGVVNLEFGIPLPGGGGGFPYEIGNGLKVVDGTTLEVDAADDVEQDNTLPITSAAVYTTVGNIEILLGTI